MIIPTFPVTELIDRYLIAEIKHEKSGRNIVELDFYKQQIENFEIEKVVDLMQQLKQVHLGIWELEKELKTGTEQDLPMDEIGRRAIKIRNKNSQRIEIKNQIAQILGCKILEFKEEHLSERK
jgi:hypothetical protein